MFFPGSRARSRSGKWHASAIVPKVRRIGLLIDPRSASGDAHRDATLAAAKKLGVRIELLEIRIPEGIDQAFRIARETAVQALSVIHIGLVANQRARVVKLAMEARLPAIYSDIEFAHAGGLMTYSPDVPHQHRRAAALVDKILKGAKPADLPVELPTRFELAINMKSAKALGITFPQTILVQASRVIE